MRRTLQMQLVAVFNSQMKDFNYFGQGMCEMVNLIEDYLEDGWLIVRETPMGGVAHHIPDFFVCLVTLEKVVDVSKEEELERLGCV